MNKYEQTELVEQLEELTKEEVEKYINTKQKVEDGNYRESNQTTLESAKPPDEGKITPMEIHTKEKEVFGLKPNGN